MFMVVISPIYVSELLQLCNPDQYVSIEYFDVKVHHYIGLCKHIRAAEMVLVPLTHQLYVSGLGTLLDIDEEANIISDDICIYARYPDAE